MCVYPAVPWDESLPPVMHASWAQGGGLHATYYTSSHVAGEDEEGVGLLPAPCETSLLPRRRVQVVLPIANETQAGTASIDVKAAVATCTNATGPHSKLIVRCGVYVACQHAIPFVACVSCP